MESKYHNKKPIIDGRQFDSKKEADYYCELKLLKMLGEVVDIECQVAFELQPKYKREGKTIRPIRYIADFVVTYADGKKMVIDVKGFRTKEYLLKKKMLLYKYPELDFKEE